MSSSIKNLAGQTAWYGLSTIAARFINYLLTPYLTLKATEAQYGEISIVYAFIPFMNVIFTYGMETAYFKFATASNKKDVFNTTSISLIISTIGLSLFLIIFQGPVGSLLHLNTHPAFLKMTILIIALDAFSTIPFASLRLEGRPVKFAVIKVAGILMNVLTIYFFLSVCPKLIAKNPRSICSLIYNPDWSVGYVLLANIVQSAITLLLLSKEFFGFKFNFNKELWKTMMLYGMPLIIAGFAGMINETFDRIMLSWWAPVDSVEAAKAQVGIYSACYKLSILITLAIQAFRMGAEPFFFKQAKEGNGPRVYARVMKLFVITICVMFLIVSLYLDIWKQFIRNPHMWIGLKVVPILLLANMFLGIYYNLSIWYKLSNRTMAGAWITAIGAVITLIINAVFIPYYSYMACAWATFACYGSMMVISFIWGQRVYPVPYAWKKLVAYMLIVIILYFIQQGMMLIYHRTWFSLVIGSGLLLLFLRFLSIVEKKEIQKLPFVRRLVH